tara:strand:- start:166 stop:321 length:156 start_codon:yes stop_codon:yes gene_type:complete
MAVAYLEIEFSLNPTEPWRELMISQMMKDLYLYVILIKTTGKQPILPNHEY